MSGWGRSTTGTGSGSSVASSPTNGNLTVNGTDIKVYDDTNIQTTLANKADKTDLNNKVNTSDLKLSNLTDVDLVNKTNGYVLTYDSISGKAKLQALPSGQGTGATSLSGLSDVNVTSTPPQEGDILTFSSGIWKPIANSGNGGGGGTAGLVDPVSSESIVIYQNPILTTTFTSLNLPSTQSISIPYNVVESGFGGLIATYTLDGVSSTTSILAGANTWNVGTLSGGNHTLTIGVTDGDGGVSNTLTFNMTIFNTTYSGIVTDGLIYLTDHPTTPMNLPNPNNYFQGVEKFTFVATFKAPKNSNILSRYQMGGTGNAYQITRNSNNQFVAQFYGNVTAPVSSAVITDEISYYHLVITRTDKQLVMYLNNVNVSAININNPTTDVTSPLSSLNVVLGTSGTVFKNMAYYNRNLLLSELNKNYVILGA